MSKNYFKSGEWNVTCDVCSKKLKAHEAHHRWDGFIVCKDDYETRHEQDFVRARQDKISVPFQRPIPTLIFGHVCTPYTSQGRTDIGVADCARSDYVVEPSEYCTIVGSTSLTGHAIVGCAVTGKFISGMII
jgi:hypothetical protein